MQIFLWSCKSVTCLQAATYNFLVRTPGRVPGLMTSGIMTSQDDMSISKLISKVRALPISDSPPGPQTPPRLPGPWSEKVAVAADDP